VHRVVVEALVGRLPGRGNAASSALVLVIFAVGVACCDHGSLTFPGSEAALDWLWSLSPTSTARLETRIKESTVRARRPAVVSAYRYTAVRLAAAPLLVRSESENHNDQQPCLMIFGPP